MGKWLSICRCPVCVKGCMPTFIQSCMVLLPVGASCNTSGSLRVFDRNDVWPRLFMARGALCCQLCPANTC